MMKLNINKKFLPLKGHYFLFNGGTGPVMSFLSIYARQLGFSSAVVGVIYTILPICGLFVKPIVGALADRYKWQKKSFIIAQLIIAVTYIAIFYSPHLPINNEVQYECDSSEAEFITQPISNVNDCFLKQLNDSSSIKQCNLDCIMNEDFINTICADWNQTTYCDNPDRPERLQFTAQVPMEKVLFIENRIHFRINSLKLDDFVSKALCPSNKISVMCNAECDDYNINDAFIKPAIDGNEAYNLYQFWVFLLFMVISWSAQAVVVSVGDAICFEILADKPNKYGAQRCFGSMGWGIISIIAGFLMDSLSKDQTSKNYIASFYLGAAFLVLDAIVSYKLDVTQTNLSVTIIKDIRKLFCNVRIYIYLIWCICIGLFTSLIWNFLFWLIEDLASKQGCDTQNWVKSLEGFIIAVQCLIGEVPFFFFSGWIMKKLGHINTMTLIMFAFACRLLLYSFITNPWWFLPVELLNGLTFGLFYSCMVSYASILAPPGTEATMQGLVGALFEGVGVSIGSFTAGLIYEEYGGQVTYRIYGVAALILTALHIIVQFIVSKFEGREGYTLPTEQKYEDLRQALPLVDNK